MIKMNLTEIVEKLKKGNRYVTVSGAVDYRASKPLPVQYSGIFQGKEDGHLIFTDYKVHSAPVDPTGRHAFASTKRDEPVKIQLEQVEEDKYTLPVDPESQGPTEVPSDDRLEGLDHIIDLSEEYMEKLRSNRPSAPE